MRMMSSGSSDNDAALCSVPRLPPLKNRYFALRHGLSTANVAGIISSLPSVGTTIHGLTEEGKVQARAAAPDILEAIGGPEQLQSLVVYASDFTRARETGEEAVDALWESFSGSPGGGSTGGGSGACAKAPVLEEVGLRERWFGDLDGEDVSTYNDVWPLDLENAHHTTFGVESVNSVAGRIRDMFLRLEKKHSSAEGGVPILLTSHADTLQIMQTYVANADVRYFSQYRFKNGEGRPLLQSPSSLPKPAPLQRDVSRV